MRRTSAHAAEKRRAGEIDLAQRRGEQAVVLEAVAAAPFVEKLPLQIADRERNPAARLNGEVVEQERLVVRAVQALQRVRVRV